MPTTTYRPSADQASGYPFIDGAPNSGSGNLYLNVNQAALDPDRFIFANFPATTLTYRARMGIPVGDMSGKAVTNVRIGLSSEQGFTNAAFEGTFRVGGVDYTHDHLQPTSGYPTYTSTTHDWATNPTTGLAWTQTEVEAFASDNNYTVGFSFFADDAPGTTIGCGRMEMIVTWTQIGLPHDVWTPPAAVNQAANW